MSIMFAKHCEPLRPKIYCRHLHSKITFNIFSQKDAGSDVPVNMNKTIAYQSFQTDSIYVKSTIKSLRS